MAANPTPQTQINTAEVNPSATVPLPTGDLPVNQPGPAAPTPGVVPTAPPTPMQPDAGTQARQTQSRDEDPGVEDEAVIWEGRYAMRNVLGRLIGLGIVSLGWVGLSVYNWGYRDQSNAGLTAFLIVSGIVVVLFWLALLRRILLARYSHFYRLTSRRLFVSTGLFVRRRDQLELLKVQDVYTRQTFTQRLFSLGTVIVVSKDQHFPVLYLTGVDDPKGVMDLIWRQSRAERDNRSVHVDQV
jgi:membrane protein YdbS with pleckstrin-like domain